MPPIPDLRVFLHIHIISTSTVYDVVITGVRTKDKFRGAAARNAEIKKHKHCEECRDQEVGQLK
jgi:hypothetical protein